MKIKVLFNRLMTPQTGNTGDSHEELSGFRCTAPDLQSKRGIFYIPVHVMPLTIKLS